jgi:hypothetical protein
LEKKVKKARTSFDANALYDALNRDLENFWIHYCPYTSSDGIPKSALHRAREEMRDKFLTKLVTRGGHKADLAAWTAMKESNLHCQQFDLAGRLRDLNSVDQTLVGEFARFFEAFWLTDLGPDLDLNWGNIAANGDTGPGVSLGGHGTSYYEKYTTGPLAASSHGQLSMYKADLALWPERQIAEVIRSLTFGEPTVEPRARASFAPKNAKVSRLITIQPGITMWYQLGLGRLLEERLKRIFGIDLSTAPDINRRLAWHGSRSSSRDSFATVDLSEASNRISLKFVGQFVPVEYQDMLLKLRMGSVESSKFNEVVEAHLVGFMGEGFTFPLMTAIFASAAAAAVSLDDTSTRSMPRACSVEHAGGRYSVFGDDIVVPTTCYDRLLRLLDILGHKPNVEKSFGSGCFRESCGMDFYEGHNVRPVFLRTDKPTAQDLTVLINQLTAWSARQLAPLPETLEYLINEVNTLGGTYLVPLGEAEDAGIRVPYEILRKEAIVKDPWVQAVKYHRWEAQPYELRFPPKGIEQVCESPRYNLAGLYLAVLRGECRGGRIAIRRNGASRYQSATAISPWWDYCGPVTAQAYVGDVVPDLAPYLRRLSSMFYYFPVERVKRPTVKPRPLGRGVKASAQKIRQPGQG